MRYRRTVHKPHLSMRVRRYLELGQREHVKVKMLPERTVRLCAVAHLPEVAHGVLSSGRGLVSEGARVAAGAHRVVVVVAVVRGRQRHDAPLL